MSRNLCHTDCCQCGGPVELEETARLIATVEAGRYFGEYGSWLQVSNAHCAYCSTRYLAWMSDRPGYPSRHPEGEIRDLSYRSSFNDEPGASDVNHERVKWVVARQQESAFMLDQLLRRGPLS